LEKSASDILTLEWKIENPKLFKPTEIATELPFNIQPNENHTVAKFTLVHTLPSFNAKGRAVTYRTQHNSIASVKFNPVSFEHQMVSNANFSFEDLVLGVMLGATLEEVPGNPIIPDRPIPTEVWAILWNRIDIVQRIVDDVKTGYRAWKASYEIRNRTEDAILVGDTFTPVSQAPQELLEAIGPESTGEWQGQKVLLVLGGQDGFIDYWGAGLTVMPADPLNPEIEIASKRRFCLLSFCKATENAQETTIETGSRPNPETYSKTGGSVMTKEEKEKLEQELAQIASLSPTLQALILNSGLDAAKAKQLGDTIQAENQAKAEELSSKIEAKYAKEYVLLNEHNDKVQEAIKTALETELPKARKFWEDELASITNREKAVTDAQIPLTESRKAKLRSFACDENGDKEFASYLDELKEIASVTKKPETANKQTETASIGGLLNTNGITEPKPELELAGLFK